jgi:hypothetical protein
MKRVDQGYKNLAGTQTFTFEEAMTLVREVLDAYGSPNCFTGMGGNMICDLVNLAAIRATEQEREACAALCESLFDADDDSCTEAETCASKIRARKP